MNSEILVRIRSRRSPGAAAVAGFAVVLMILTMAPAAAECPPDCDSAETRKPLPNLLGPLLGEVDLVASGRLEAGIELPGGSWDAFLTVADGIYGVESGQVLRVLLDEPPQSEPARAERPRSFLLAEAEGAAVRIVDTVGLNRRVLWDATDLVCNGHLHPALMPLIRLIVQRHGVAGEVQVVMVCPGETQQRFLHAGGWEAVAEGPPPRVTEISRKARIFIAALVLDTGAAAEPQVIGKTVMGLDEAALGFLAEVPLPRDALYLEPDEPVAVVVAFERPIPPIVQTTKCAVRAVD